MDKQYILEEIKRTATANGGKPLGLDRFSQITGIREYDWRGKYWENFGDAQEEAGFERNGKQEAYDESFLIEKLITFVRELGRFPTEAALRMKRRSDANFPNSKTFVRLGRTLQDRITAVGAYCRGKSGYEDVLAICDTATVKGESAKAQSESGDPEQLGFVYLMKSGRYYKIGRTSHVGGRERDLAIQLPDKLSTVHSIRTDDPAGIEDYWHKRFEEKRTRKNCEWFDLTADDIRAFKRRNFM